jgi:ribonuclease III
LFRRIFNFFKSRSEHDQRLITGIKQITGYEPFRLELYRLATLHSSMAEVDEMGVRISNERLEYLGDAILGAVVAEYLFKKYPFKDEGFLTEIRSRIVNRESLNLLARKIALDKLIQYEKRNKQITHKSIYGDSMEALIGAVYLDKGYKKCKKFIINKLLIPHFDLDTLVKTNNNYKSQLIEWAQKNGKEIRFEVDETQNTYGHREFIAKVLLDGVVFSDGIAVNKKKAEQSASFKACNLLEIEQ